MKIRTRPRRIRATPNYFKRLQQRSALIQTQRLSGLTRDVWFQLDYWHITGQPGHNMVWQHPLTQRQYNLVQSKLTNALQHLEMAQMLQVYFNRADMLSSHTYIYGALTLQGREGDRVLSQIVQPFDNLVRGSAEYQTLCKIWCLLTYLYESWTPPPVTY
jgi:hypothetical protein